MVARIPPQHTKRIECRIDERFCDRSILINKQLSFPKFAGVGYPASSGSERRSSAMATGGTGGQGEYRLDVLVETALIIQTSLIAMCPGADLPICLYNVAGRRRF